MIGKGEEDGNGRGQKIGMEEYRKGIREGEKRKGRV